MYQIIKSVFLQLFELIFHRQTTQIFSTNQLVAYGFGFSIIKKKKKLPVYGFGDKKKNPYYENSTF